MLIQDSRLFGTLEYTRVVKKSEQREIHLKNYCHLETHEDKGQKISKGNFGVFKFPKKKGNIFLISALAPIKWSNQKKTCKGYLP